MDGYSFSGDEKKMMIETGSEPIYRHSYFAYNYVFDRASKKLVPLSDITKAKQRLATFSPDGSKAAFVRDNNLFVVDLGTMKEEQITNDGEWNKVLNGATDWVYEEEFTLVQGYAWSPDGSKLLYLRSDESGVKEFDLTLYKNQLYPSEYRFKYPKAGEANSSISLHVRDLAAGLKNYLPNTGNQVKSVYKHYPLDKACNPSLGSTVHPGACDLALAGICAEESGRFWEFHDKVVAMKERTIEDMYLVRLKESCSR